MIKWQKRIKGLFISGTMKRLSVLRTFCQKGQTAAKISRNSEVDLTYSWNKKWKPYNIVARSIDLHFLPCQPRFGTISRGKMLLKESRLPTGKDNMPSQKLRSPILNCFLLIHTKRQKQTWRSILTLILSGKTGWTGPSGNQAKTRITRS